MMFGSSAEEILKLPPWFASLSGGALSHPFLYLVSMHIDGRLLGDGDLKSAAW